MAEDDAKREDARMEREHLRHIDEHGDVDKTNYKDSGDATDSEIAEIDSLTKKMKDQQKLLTDKKRKLQLSPKRMRIRKRRMTRSV